MKNTLIVALILAVVSSGLMAEDIFVQPGDNTITAALATAEAGDRLVLVYEGVYSNDPLFVYKPVTIKAWDDLENKPVVSFLWAADSAIIAGQEKTLAFTYASLALEGLEVTMEGDPALTDGITTRMFRNRAYTGVNWEFNDCLFRDASQPTMSITGVLDTFLLADGSEFIDGIDFVDNEGVVIDGVTVAEDGVQGVLDTLIIDNCVFKNFIGGGAKINHAPSDGRGVYSYAQFTNNTVFNVDHHAINIRMKDVDGGSDYSLYGTAVFDHNTIHGVGGSNRTGIFFKWVNPASYITNTTISDVSGKAINILNTGNDILVDYSNWYNAGTGPSGQWDDGGHNLQVDPLFADASTGDLTLPETSPLVGAGSNGSTIGDPRWAPDISGNLAPVAVAGADIVIESDDGSETVTLDGSASYDPNGDALTYSWTLDGTVVSTDVSFSYDLTLGDYTFTLTVSDGELTSSDDVVVSVIDPIQYPPVADAGENIAETSTDGGSVTVTLDGSGSYDPNGDAITYSWTLDGAEVSTAVSFSYELDIGVYTFTLTVSDGELTDSDDVVVTVNSPPGEGDNVALSFTGANEDYVDLGDNSELQLGDHNLTIEFSFKISDGAGIVQRIIGNGGTMTSDDGFSVKILSNGKLRADVSDGTTNDGKQTSFTVNDGQWHKAMFMLDRDHPQGQKMWLCSDGVCNTKIINSSIGSCANTNDTFVLGRKSTTSANDSFTGNLDEVRIWNTALDTANVSLWRNGELTSLHPNISNLQAYYKFNENSGSTANDLTADYLDSYESDGTITGAEWVASDIPNFAVYDDEDLQGEASGTEFTYLAGWNLVGLPLEVENSNYLNLFPTAVSGTLYGFNGTYESGTELAPGTGYWLNFSDAGSTTIAGSAISSITISLSQGWNLISGISETTDVSAISDPGGIIVPGTVYGFDGIYASSSQLDPGQGYWINANADGDITISGGAAARTIAAFTDCSKEANILSFNGSELYFGVSIPEEEMLSYQLPPKPPAGAFDVRFAEDMKVTESAGAIEIMNNTDMLTISYTINIDAGEHLRWVLTSDEGKEYELNGSAEIVVDGNVNHFTLNKVSSIPTEFALSQNFPNPFNPTTSISYSLPENSDISISVYNLTGQKIIELVDDHVNAGMYTVTWNGTNHVGVSVSSGVYIYMLQSDSFTAVKKMILIK